MKGTLSTVVPGLSIEKGFLNDQIVFTNSFLRINNLLRNGKHFLHRYIVIEFVITYFFSQSFKCSTPSLSFKFFMLELLTL